GRPGARTGPPGPSAAAGRAGRNCRPRPSAHPPPARSPPNGTPTGTPPRPPVGARRRPPRPGRSTGTRPSAGPSPLRRLPPDPPPVALRGARRGRDDGAVQVEQDRPPTDDGGERGDDALRALALKDGTGQRVLGLERPRQQVVLLGHQTREHRLGDRDER